MYRAQKASSKLCRDREVEKAQDLHRRKIDGVKSYLAAITRPPAPSVPISSKSRSATFFRRSLRQHVAAPKRSEADNGVKSSCSGDNGDGYSDDDCAHSRDGHGSEDECAIEVSECGDEVATKSFGKLDELRSVLVPVMAYKGSSSDTGNLDYERYLDEITNPTPPPQEPPKPEPVHQSMHSLRARAFRMRRLKQIEADNVTIFERIKNSSPHYRSEAFKKEWDQNITYLTSICEFPVVEEAVHVPSPRKHTHARKRSPFPSRPPETLPSLQLATPPIIHPIKAIPTSPKKTHLLNLSPAFRSLRKGLPQVPALPPLTASPRAANVLKSKSMSAVASSRSSLQFDDDSMHTSPESVPKQNASPSSIHRATGPLQTPKSSGKEDIASDPGRYTLLKVGRFVGGKYLVLTVYCGDGITNPYGFDVVAMDPEVHVEFHLSITKETTHLLLETISSTSMAERTAAAAGTNLSMDLIARCICDHIRYARIGASEVVFLVATVGNPSGLSGDTATGLDEDQLHHNSHLSVSDNASLLVDTIYSAMTFCFYQYVRISPPRIESDSIVYAHVFASTRPQQCCRASMRDSVGSPVTTEPLVQASGSEYNGLVCFDVRKDSDPSQSIAQLQVSVSELVRLFEQEAVIVRDNARERLSLDRFIMMSLQYLHLVGDRHGCSADPQLVLTPSTPNSWGSPVVGSPRHPPSTVLSNDLDTRQDPCRTRSCQSVVLHGSHPDKILVTLGPNDELKIVLQTGMLWRGSYLFARVALLSPGVLDQLSGTVIRDPTDELLVINILNTSTGNYSECVLHGDQVEEFSQKLGTWQSSVAGVPPLVMFAKLLLLRLRLDVDLRGQEIILFPTLEPRYYNAGGRTSPIVSSRRSSPVKRSIDATENHLESVNEAEPTLQSETHELETAAKAIQTLVRRFIRRRKRRQYRASLHKTTETWTGQSIYEAVPQEESLSALVLSFAKNRAAKRIQFASRNYSQRARGRIAPIVVNDTTVANNVDEDCGNDVLKTHTDVLAILEEDERDEEEEEENTEDSALKPGGQDSGESLDVLTMKNEDFHEPTAKPMGTSSRVGKKIDGRFVLQRRSIDWAGESGNGVLDVQIIGRFGLLTEEH